MEEVLAKYFSNELTPKERKEVEGWRDESDSNADEFLAYSKIWHSESQVDTDLALQSILSEIQGLPTEEAPTTTNKEPKASQVFVHFFKIAAAVLVGVGLGYFVLTQFNLLDISTEYSSDNSLLDIELTDGTQVTLSPNSTLTYRETDTERIVSLNGKAFFDVKRDESRVFSILTEYNKVEVLGTSFLVDASGTIRSAEVVVESGLVAVSSSDSESDRIELKAGEKAYFDDAARLLKSSNRNSNYLAWKTHLISFQSEPLGQVVEFLNQNFDVKVELSNEGLENCALTADFKDQEVNDILEIISLTFSLELKKLSNNRFVLSGEGC